MHPVQRFKKLGDPEAGEGQWQASLGLDQRFFQLQAGSASKIPVHSTMLFKVFFTMGSSRNKLTQKAIARECADWIRQKAIFRSNKTKSAMQQFACIHGDDKDFTYMPLNGFSAVDLGYQPSDAISSIVNKIDEPSITKTYLELFNKIWHDPDKLEDVTTTICDYIASVYQENSPERIYF